MARLERLVLMVAMVVAVWPVSHMAGVVAAVQPAMEQERPVMAVMVDCMVVAVVGLEEVAPVSEQAAMGHRASAW